jgi:hypothetical protein
VSDLQEHSASSSSPPVLHLLMTTLCVLPPFVPPVPSVPGKLVSRVSWISFFSGYFVGILTDISSLMEKISREAIIRSSRISFC